jgi:hypothetical protein
VYLAGKGFCMFIRNFATSAAVLLAMSAFALAQDDSLPAPPPYPNQGYYGQYAPDSAYQRGYQDGVADGMKDSRDGRVARPTATDKYEDAPGYNKSYGDKKVYKNVYRQGYVAGYPQGFNGYAQPAYPVYVPQVPVYGSAAPVYGGNPAAQLGYRDGLNDGARDRTSGHAARPMATDKYEDTPGYDNAMGDKETFKQIYRQAYSTGYQQAYSGNPVYGQAPYAVYSPGYPVAAYPPPNATTAYQLGFQDGLMDGRNDRQSGKTFRATKNDKYEDAPGYNKALGDKSTYKMNYRQGYVNGYEAGFNGAVK